MEINETEHEKPQRKSMKPKASFQRRLKKKDTPLAGLIRKKGNNMHCQ